MPNLDNNNPAQDTSRYPEIPRHPPYSTGDPKLSVLELLRSIVDRLEGAAGVKTAYGEPIEVKEKTILPVAQVAYAFGAGQGEAKPGDTQETPGGGGGGITIRPKGVLEITRGSTRFISFSQTRNLAAALIVGLLLGAALVSGSKKRS